MQVILLAKLDNLGLPGDIVTVKPGYARNYLIPRGLAEIVNKQRKKYFLHKKMLAEKLQKKHLEEAKQIAEKIKDFTLSISKKVSAGDKLYARVTAQDIVQEFRKHGFEFHKKQISIQDIQTLGVFNGEIRLHAEITSPIKVWVVAESSESQKS